MIFKHSKDTDHPEPYYELLGFIDPKSPEPIVLQSSETMRQLVWSIYGDLYSSYVFRRNLDNQGNESALRIYTDVYSRYSIRKILTDARFAIVGQYLDNYGKCRGYLVAQDETLMTILCMPQQPIDEQVETIVYPLLVADLEDLTRLFGQPTHVDIEYLNEPDEENNGSVKERLRGLWFGIGDYDMAIYLPIEMEDREEPLSSLLDGELLSLPHASNPLVMPEDTGSFNDYLSNEERLSRLLEVIAHLYRAYAKEIVFPQIYGTGNAPIDPTTLPYEPGDYTDPLIRRAKLRKSLLTDFTKFLRPKTTPLSDTFYLLDDDHLDMNMVRTTTNLDDLIELLLPSQIVALRPTEGDTGESVAPSSAWQIRMPSTKTSPFYDDLVYYVERFLVVAADDFYDYRPLPPPSNAFVSLPQFQEWMRSQIAPDQFIISATDLTREAKLVDASALMAVDSYLAPQYYRDPQGALFVIQNVKNGDKGRATAVSLIWLREGVNIGPEITGANSVDVDRATVYTITGRQIVAGLRPEEETKGGDLRALVLEYPNKRYAALLPLKNARYDDLLSKEDEDKNIVITTDDWPLEELVVGDLPTTTDDIDIVASDEEKEIDLSEEDAPEFEY